MNRKEFLGILEDGLRQLPEKERQDVIYDYEEHFQVGLEEGKTEEEIATSLGDPRFIAKEFKANYMFTRAENHPSTTNIFRAVFATLSLGFFNLIFVLGPFLGLVGIIIGLFGGSIGLIFSGLGLLVAIILSPFSLSFISLPIFVVASPLAGIFLSIGVTALGLLMLIGVSYLALGTYKLTIKYLKFNLKIITDRRSKNEY